MAKVFIGMPAYNGERFIREAIDSLRAQSFTDWEMLVSDDASTDSTSEICQAYAKEDPRITYYRQEKNIGQFKNFKFLIDQAKGDYFMWAGQDDLWNKDFLSLCTSNLEKHSNITIAGGSIAEIDSFGRTVRETPDFPLLSGKPSARSVARYINQPEILGKCNIMYCLFRLDAIKKIWEIYPQKSEWGSDYHFSLAAISHFGILIEKKVIFKKRQGGYSSPQSIANDRRGILRNVTYENPKNHMFPFGRFKSYLGGHLKALRNSKYHAIAILILYLRLPRAFLIHVKDRVSSPLLRESIGIILKI